MQRYAAHDSFFMVGIAHKQIKSISEREGVDGKLVTDFKDFEIWFANYQTKLHKHLNE